MTPLYSLKGASENLPKKKDEAKCLEATGDNRAYWFNLAITQTENCSVSIDEEKLALKLKEIDEGYGEAYESIEHYKENAKSLSATMKEWLEIRRVENE